MADRPVGRPRLDPISIHLTLLPELLAQVDAWMAVHGSRSRAEAVREVLVFAFAEMAERPPRRGAVKVSKPGRR